MWTLNGAIQFGIWPGVFKIASSVLAPVHRRKAMFYIVMSSSVGLIASYILAGVTDKWQYNFLVSAILLSVCSIYWITLDKFLKGKMVDTDVVLEEHRVPEFVRDNSNIRLMYLLFKSGMLLIMPIEVFQAVLSHGVQSLTPSMITENYENISASAASIITIIPLAASILGKFVMDKIYKKMHHTECSVMTVCFIIMIPVLSMLMFIGEAGLAFIIPMISLCLILSNGIYLILTTYVNAHFAAFGKSGTISGIINCMGAIGIIITNIVSTRIADNFGWNSVIALWIVYALISVLLGIAAYFPWKKFTYKGR